MGREHCERIARILDDRGLDRDTSTIVAVICRTERRAQAMEVWLEEHKTATEQEIIEKAREVCKMDPPRR